VTIPLVGRGLEISLGRELDLAPPIPVLLAQLIPMLALPIAIGMWVRRRWPDVALRYRPICERLAFIGVGIVLGLIILDDPRTFVSDLPGTVPLAAVFVVCSTAVGWMTAAAVTEDPRDRFTLAAEFGTRNLGVAMAVAVTVLGRVEFARFAYTYFLIEMPILLAAVALFRRAQAAET
jgi:BASS family bile acid:Na+ symporter